ncbi:SagB/ThcOx family dehydrogenase [Pelagibacterium xiamenense]|uniref:SagB/ThcOx family dehydrogenase n=1 Tax=Pelagibacterium xiamenense TaxID=2901140 RepID=UPI001E637C62|nr:SagB/ThcOx family dehydrogenase [Pelagibacterium xiamenense]MCD7061248.1 SagB/ThcOx family dehydrogenase [Pelagibacterium xiamenense]
MTDFEALLQRRRSERAFGAGPVSRTDVDRLLFAAQGRTGAPDKRTIPSAHGLNPLRLTLTVSAVEGMDAGLYGIDPTTLALDLREQSDVRAALETAAIDDQPWIGASAAILTIAADFGALAMHFADQPGLGMRGTRYGLIEAGACAQTVHLAACNLGLASIIIAGIDEAATARMLGLAPPVAPIAHICIGPRPAG